MFKVLVHIVESKCSAYGHCRTYAVFTNPNKAIAGICVEVHSHSNAMARAFELAGNDWNAIYSTLHDGMPIREHDRQMKRCTQYEGTPAFKKSLADLFDVSPTCMDRK